MPITWSKSTGQDDRDRPKGGIDWSSVHPKVPQSIQEPPNPQPSAVQPTPKPGLFARIGHAFGSAGRAIGSVFTPPTNKEHTPTQRFIMGVPETINRAVFGTVGSVAGGAAALLASPVTTTIDRALGKSPKQTMLDVFQNIKQTADASSHVFQSVVPDTVAFAGESAMTGVAVARGGLGLATGNAKDLRALYDRSVQKVKEYTTLAAQATGTEPPTDQELHYMLNSPSGQLLAGGALALDLFFLGKGAVEVKSALVDKRYKLLASQEIRPAEESITPEGAKVVSPPRPVEGTESKAQYDRSQFLNVDRALQEAPSKQPVNVLRVTPTDNGTVRFDYYRYERPFSRSRTPYQTDAAPIPELGEPPSVDQATTAALRSAQLVSAPVEVLDPGSGRVSLETSPRAKALAAEVPLPGARPKAGSSSPTPADISKRAANSLENRPVGIKAGAVERAVNEINAGTTPAVKLRTLEDGSVTIEDGRHHLEAARQLGLETYPTEDVTQLYRSSAKPRRIVDVAREGEVADRPQRVSEKLAKTIDQRISELEKICS